jgi:predicted metal-dependent hydrolase
MSTEKVEIRVSGQAVQIIRKNIKNLHLGVYPPNGRVRVAAPLRVSDDAVRLAVIGKLGWIKRQQARFKAQARQSDREMVSGESHYYLGRRYRLRVVERNGPSRVVLRNRSTLELQMRGEYSAKKREQVLLHWYRERLRELVPSLLAKWEAILDIRAAAFGIRKMKTKWGSCSVTARRIWLNLELAKKPAHCLEYIVVHELVHLIERHHNDSFIALLDRHLPHWRHHRKILNEAPLGHADWTY